MYDARRPSVSCMCWGDQAGLRVLDLDAEEDPVARASRALSESRELGFDVLIVDTAGRLHVDDELMDELSAID